MSDEKKLGKCDRCGAEVEINKNGSWHCDKCHCSAIFIPKIEIEESVTTCPLCGSRIPCNSRTLAIEICPDCKALWKKLQREFTTKVGSTVVASTKEQDLLGFYGRVLQVRTGEALVEFPMVKGKRVVTWLKDEEYTEVE